MKTQRRHELKTNTLARKMEDVPNLARRYGDKVLLAIIVVCLAIILVRYYLQQAEETRAAASSNLTAAETAINDLMLSSLNVLGSQEQLAAVRDNEVLNAEGALEIALRTAPDAQMRAEVYLARGNLNWALANYPALPAAATQPALALKKPSDEYLSAAQSAYSQVLIDPLSQNHHALTGARLGLAAIAENRRDWDTASHYYQLVSDDPKTETSLQDYAKLRTKMLDELKRPVLLASVAPPAPVLPSFIGPRPGDGPLNDLPPLSLTPLPPTTAPSTAPTTPTTQPGGK